MKLTFGKEKYILRYIHVFLYIHIFILFSKGRYNNGELVSLPTTLSYEELQAKVVEYFPKLVGEELSFFRAVGSQNILKRLKGSVADFKRQGLRKGILYIKAGSEVG